MRNFNDSVFKIEGQLGFQNKGVPNRKACLFSFSSMTKKLLEIHLEDTELFNIHVSQSARKK